jgi:hypothetical protein
LRKKITGGIFLKKPVTQKTNIGKLKAAVLFYPAD